MIQIENIEVFGFEAAIRGMRNPLNSWEMSDSSYKESECRYIIGENDKRLMKKLTSAGSDHGKYTRMINVTMDITAPLYWWKEYDTYKVGTVANSCSTMHKIHAKEFTPDDFSHEHLMSSVEKAETELLDIDKVETNIFVTPKSLLNITIGCLNHYRKMYLETNDKDWWWQMIQLLPSSYNQKRTVQVNYEVLKSMYFARKGHKLDEWRSFCQTIKTLPYFEELFLEGGNEIDN